jgi:hypothetical protein
VIFSKKELEKRIHDLRARLPQHSVPAAMLIELEELEDELARRRFEESGDRRDQGPDGG